jgi:Protein of unknown function (DUF3604)
MNLYFGDLHNHCGISYGHGTLEAALARAREQLDFCSVTGHAFWPDMPTDRQRYGPLIDFHTEGFQRLAGQWGRVLATFDAFHEPGRFVTFPGYEWHSRAYGDQVVVLKEAAGPLVTGDSVDALEAALGGREHLLYPHHIGYPRGYRGVNWDAFDGARAPLVEIFSMHGCSESDEAPYPMLHTMGPRDHDSTVQTGLARGLRFGFVAGTDHHSGYPGSWGDGRMAVWADSLTREALFEAFRARRTYAVTGDKIGVEFSVAGAPPGAVIAAPGRREIAWGITACGFVDKVELLKNNRLLATWNGALETRERWTGPVRAKIRVEWGWGSKETPMGWEGTARLAGGELLDVESCFNGPPILAPTAGHEEEIALPHQLLDRDGTGCRWRSRTWGNPTIRHRTTQALVLTVEMGPTDRLELAINGERIRHTLAELLEGARGHYMRGLQSEAVRIHRAVPEPCYRMAETFIDTRPEQGTDCYYLRVSQRNDQWAWVTPVWVERG